jgi:hypothetical protein
MANQEHDPSAERIARERLADQPRVAEGRTRPSPQPAAGNINSIQVRAETFLKEIKDRRASIATINSDHALESTIISGAQAELDRIYQDSMGDLSRRRERLDVRTRERLAEHQQLLHSAIAGLNALEGRQISAAEVHQKLNHELESLASQLADERSMRIKAERMAEDLAQRATAGLPTKGKRKPISRAAAAKAVDAHVRGHSKEVAAAREIPGVKSNRSSVARK